MTTFPNLPVITWTVGPAGSTLVGRCTVDNPTARRTEFAMWCAVLGATPRPDHTSGAVTHLQAFIDDLDGVHINLIADVQEVNHGTR